ncbi:Na/Pi cotransporter [Anoxybacter fermentans]|uniref:Na/Pi cotransporter n=2 Tax=Anoxybacter fermentans TaxID=1323375 RepID=A0A3Q9HSJ2_9FIRM|nr:Na/Pi cotransporter [Anoxybacter fermentans]
MKMMGEGLTKTAGKKLKNLLEVLTTNRLAGVLVGTGVTAIIQSSSATTVMVVGFVNAGLMNLKQAIGVIMGANIGTTITAQLIAFKIDKYSLSIIAIGAALYLFGKSKRMKYIGQIFLGFGFLFLGMNIMKDIMKPLRGSQYFRDMMMEFSHNPILGVLMGTFMTILIQSSSASIGILLSLTSVGAIPYSAAVPILLGDNIGTTITAILSSIGTNRTAKRAAWAHAMFNILGATTFLIFMYTIPNLTDYITLFFKNYFGTTDINRLVANTHTGFNVLNTIIWLPFAGVLAKIVTWLIPGEEKVVTKGPIYLDERFLDTPALALGQAGKELERMAQQAILNVETAQRLFMENNLGLFREVEEREENIDQLEEAMILFMSKLSQRSLTEDQAREVNNFFHIINDVERIGDHAENIAELGQIKVEEKMPFSEKAIEDLNYMFARVIETARLAIKAFSDNDLELAKKVLKFEDEVDELETTYRKNHIQRLNEGLCFPGSGVVYLDILSNLERIGDHSANIAKIIIEGIKK